jgi:Transcriptional repressor TCF25
MSSRAIQRLREERGAPVLDPQLDNIEEEEEEDHERGQRGFLAMMDDSDSESEEEEAEDEEEGPIEPETKKEESNLDANIVSQKDYAVEGEEEDLDALLAEFESKDEAFEETKPSAAWFHVIVSNLDARDLDIDYVMRTLLLGGDEDSARRSRQSFLFGPPRDGWVRPPHYMGGGIGMTSYDTVESRQFPWPYHQKESSLEETQWRDPKQWFTFQYSDTYEKDLKDYERIQNSGDVNALALFVAHHPFVVEALLQLSMVLYRTNQSQEGLALLRRSLWILECSSISSFRVLQKSCFMDYDQPENASYFSALFRMIQISGIAGYGLTDCTIDFHSTRMLTLVFFSTDVSELPLPFQDIC